MADTIDQKTETCTRGLFDSVEVRAGDKDSRTATFVAATENGVETWAGREYLRISGGDLGRYRSNPVVLDTHNRYEAGAVIGRATISTKARELIAEVTFAETDRAEEVWQLVRTGFVKALSIGFLAHDVQRVEEGESAGSGKSRIEGPARIVKKWELYEISVVPVPADAETLRRSFLHGGSVELISEVRSLRQALNDVLAKEADMPKNEDDKAPATEGTKSEAEMPKEDKIGSRTAQVPEFTVPEIIARQIRAIAPEPLKDFAEQCILEGLSLEDARKRMLEEYAKHQESAGTQSTDVFDTGKKEERAEDKAAQVDKIDDDTFVRALCGA